MNAHSASLRSPVVTGVALVILWLLSWALSYANFGEWSFVIALCIAGLKAVLVGLFFMELIHESSSFNFAIIAGISLIAILITLTVLDVTTRAPEPITPTVAGHFSSS